MSEADLDRMERLGLRLAMSAHPRFVDYVPPAPFAERDLSVPLTRTPPARSPKLWLWVFLFGALCWAVLWGGWELFVAIVRAL